MNEASTPWTQRNVEPLGWRVGPCAWRASILAGEEGEARVDYLRAHPSLLIMEPGDDALVVARVAKLAGELPVLLAMDEPEFVRRFAGQIRERVAQLGCEKVAAIVLRVRELPELKAGGLLQVLFDLREQGVMQHIGLCVEDALAAEWLSPRTAARVLMLPYALDEQTARYRALPLVQEMDQLCIASDPVNVQDEKALRFALGDAQRVLPLLDQPLPASWNAMSAPEVEEAWTQYQAMHEEPAKLPRSHAPD